MKANFGIAPAWFAAGGAFLAAGTVFFIHPYFSAAVLAAFVLMCAAGAVLGQSGFFLPVVCKGPQNTNSVALTFDDGPHPETTPALLELLERWNAPALFFVTGQKARKHPEIIQQILAAGHCIGNHTYSHDVFVMLRPAKKLDAEIARTQEILAWFNIRPTAFRPPAGVVNPKLRAILEKYKMRCILYSCRGPDMGNRRIKGLAARISRKVRAGDIILLHDGHPGTARFDPRQWVAEIEKILIILSKKGIMIRSVSGLTGLSVMHDTARPEKTGHETANEANN
ncbi:MAG: polysaccharide deacetylase family protein [Desulfobacterales bacterium]|nr:polysaccharide deacetylase family protein [Desulfobacterales bacterium]